MLKFDTLFSDNFSDLLKSLSEILSCAITDEFYGCVYKAGHHWEYQSLENLTDPFYYSDSSEWSESETDSIIGDDV
uniref:Uncharacterized protein n=1 Tax=Bird deltacoronavirus PluvialisCN24 TaxID=3237955 RepID=A0AB39AFM5_9NIDO